MTTATLGDLLLTAADHLTTATQRSRHQREPGHLASAISETARAVGALRRYLTNVITDSGIQPYLSTGNATIYAAIHAREALQTAAEHLITAGKAFHHLKTTPDPDPLTPDIATATGHLTAGHDLLRTHFTADIDGIRTPASRWSAVITSPPVTSALLQEISRQTAQLWQLTAGLSQAVTGTSALYGIAPNELDHAKHWLRRAQDLLDQAPSHNQAHFHGHLLLHAVPVNRMPAPQPLTAPEPLTDLCHGITVSAGRLHAIARASAGLALSSPLFTAESWRWTVNARAVAADLSEILLRSLAQRVQALPVDPFARRLLTAAAEAAANTCERWRHVTAAWGKMTTSTTGLTAPGVADSTDLLIRLGRLAFDNQHWTPARERQAPVRDPAGLAPGPAQLVTVFAAVHQAADALASLAAADEQNVAAVIAARQIYLPVRLLSGRKYTPRPYGRAPVKDTAVLLKTYTSAAAASTELAVALDAASLVLDAPSKLIATARIATRHGQDITETGQAPELNPAWPPPPARYRLPRGPVEQQLHQLNIDNDILLLRAQAIDTAAQHLIAEAQTETSQPKNTPSSSAELQRKKKPNSRQTPAAQSFPSSAGQQASSRSPAASSQAPRAPAAHRPAQARR